jgi:acyl carrier protein
MKMTKTKENTPTSVPEIMRGFIEGKFLPSAGKESFGDDDSFMENGIIDSTGVLELLEFIEEQFLIEVEDEDIVPDNLDSINKLAQFIHKKKENVS